MRRALAGDWPEQPPHNGQVLELVCRPNLDLHSGTAGWYRRRHGNLRRDDAQVVFGRALAASGRPADALWFDLDPLPGVAELAAQHGDPHGQAVHFTTSRFTTCGWTGRNAPAAAESAPAFQVAPAEPSSRVHSISVWVLTARADSVTSCLN